MKKIISQEKIYNTLKQSMFVCDGDIDYNNSDILTKWTRQAQNNTLDVDAVLSEVNLTLKESQDDEQQDIDTLIIIKKSLEQHIEQEKIKLLDVVEIKKGYAIQTTYAMKTILKKAIPSAKWNAELKMWTVGPRSLKKLEAFVDSARKEFNIAEIETKQKELENKKHNSKAIVGHTFSFKDILKNKYNAIFDTSSKKWLVENEVYDQAQVEIDVLNIERKQKDSFIKSTDIKSTDLNSIEKTLKNTIKNITKNAGYGEYANKDDDFYQMLYSYNNRAKEWNAIQDYLTHVLTTFTNAMNSVEESYFHSENKEDHCCDFELKIDGLGIDALEIIQFFSLKQKNTISVNNNCMLLNK